MIFYFEGIILLGFLLIIITLLRVGDATKYIKRIWFHLTISVLSFLFPKPIYIYYDPKILRKTKNIVISNHLTEYDWLMLFTVLYRLKRFDNICIILKNSLRNIPLLGYGMKYFGYIFLNRKLEKDREIISEGIKRLKKNNEYDLLFFPEGTYLDSVSSQVCKEYMDKNPCILNGQIFRPTEVLLPRVTGFNLIKESLNGDADGIIDITMLVNPYKKYPQDYYTYTKTLTDFTDRVGFVFYLDYIENYNDKNFIYKRFKIKDDIFKVYKKLKNKRISSLCEFKMLTQKIKKENDTFKYEIIYVHSEWAPFFYTIFIYTVLFGYRLCKK
ncbi:hypothetical protein G9O61_00g005560 [Vairimorpha ceranae]|nr:hypothetical protein G9O61_00g005560 [Vairimorpha ceranae]